MTSEKLTLNSSAVIYIKKYKIVIVQHHTLHSLTES